jgi:hypothetical protein
MPSLNDNMKSLVAATKSGRVVWEKKAPTTATPSYVTNLDGITFTIQYGYDSGGDTWGSGGWYTELHVTRDGVKEQLGKRGISDDLWTFLESRKSVKLRYDAEDAMAKLCEEQECQQSQ